MKLKENFLLRQIAGSRVVLPPGSSAANFNGILALNEFDTRGCGRFL